MEFKSIYLKICKVKITLQMAQIYIKALYETFPCLVSLTIPNLFEEGDRDAYEFCGEMTKMKSSDSTTEKWKQTRISLL